MNSSCLTTGSLNLDTFQVRAIICCQGSNLVMDIFEIALEGLALKNPKDILEIVNKATARRIDSRIACNPIFLLFRLNGGGQLSREVKASDLGAEGPRFEPWQQHLVQLS